jgi:hypothetical protein
VVAAHNRSSDCKASVRSTNPRPTGSWSAPDIGRARGLVAASGTRGTPVTVWGWTDDPTITPRVVRYAAKVLQRLGYPARVHLVTHAFLAHPPPRVFKRNQLIPAAWGDTPYGFFATWFACAGPLNHGKFLRSANRPRHPPSTIGPAEPVARRRRSGRGSTARCHAVRSERLFAVGNTPSLSS